MHRPYVSLSVVIAAWNGSSSLQECLTSLQKQLEAGDEIIVVSNFEPQLIEGPLQELPSVVFVTMPQETDVPKLRARGIELARGDVVALLEDHCTANLQWVAEIKKAHASSHPVVGGSVENQSNTSSLSWAVYFYDYGKYMLPDAARNVTALSGNNVSYKREILREVRHQYIDGFHETFINEELQKRGYDLYLAPSAIIYHNKAYRLKGAIIDSYHHGRLFASRRVANVRFAIRAFRGLLSAVLPVLLPGRIVLRTVGKKRHLSELFICFPYLFLLTTAWSYGEFCGYFAGEGGSAGKWK